MTNRQAACLCCDTPYPGTDQPAGTPLLCPDCVEHAETVEVFGMPLPIYRHPGGMPAPAIGPTTRLLIELTEPQAADLLQAASEIGVSVDGMAQRFLEAALAGFALGQHGATGETLLRFSRAFSRLQRETS